MLRRPEGTSQFEVIVNIGIIHITDVRNVQFELFLNGPSKRHRVW